eukprot:CAMPEP_0185748578 /NCGR_PEP_ID=MMETSP1174-20130828/7285_1 /TAXON_ID=35687 /ORGANISM="Dictyocha speculum, Strain CCMP1381" /LENGTH=328 /DNA_ID=CAMNT_0028424329 /DNA_START=1 /DNA_END=984 /DNA_ORIENTATION=-
MGAVVANELLLPTMTQTWALLGGADKSEAVDSPNSPLVVSEGTAYVQQIQSYAKLYGGSGKERMKKRCLISELLVYISIHNDRLVSLDPESFLASIPYNKAHGDVFKSRLKNRSRDAIGLPKKATTARNLFIAEKRIELSEVGQRPTMAILEKHWDDFKEINQGNAGDYDRRAAEEKLVYRQKLENWLTVNHASQPLSLPWSEDALKEIENGPRKKRKKRRLPTDLRQSAASTPRPSVASSASDRPQSDVPSCRHLTSTPYHQRCFSVIVQMQQTGLCVTFHQNTERGLHVSALPSMLPEPSEHHVGPTEGTGVRVYDVLVGINSTSW